MCVLDSLIYIIGIVWSVDRPPALCVAHSPNPTPQTPTTATAAAQEAQAQATQVAEEERAKRAEAAASIFIPGLEGVDWLALLDEFEAGGVEGDGEKKKYVPEEIPLLSPAAALAARARTERQREGFKREGDEKGKGKEEGEGGERLPMRRRHVQVARDPEIQVRVGCWVCVVVVGGRRGCWLFLLINGGKGVDGGLIHHFRSSTNAPTPTAHPSSSMHENRRRAWPCRCAGWSRRSWRPSRSMTSWSSAGRRARASPRR